MGITRLEDWYAIRYSDFVANRGKSLLNLFNSSPIRFLKTIYPKHNWQTWRFSSTSWGFWKKESHHRSFLEYLLVHLSYSIPRHLYSLKMRTIHRHGGTRLVSAYYSGSPYLFISTQFPECVFYPWYFTQSPHKFWERRERRVDFLNYLSYSLRMKNLEDWYPVTMNEFCSFGGGAMLGKYYGNSPIHCLLNLLPEHDWQVWKFRNAPSWVFSDTKNWERFCEWIGEEREIETGEDWKEGKNQLYVHQHGKGFMEVFESSPISLLFAWIGVRGNEEETKKWTRFWGEEEGKGEWQFEQKFLRGTIETLVPHSTGISF